MRDKDNVEDAIKKKLSFTASAELHNRMLNDVLNAQEKSKKTKSAVAELRIGRIIMKNSITKLAAAAVIVILVVLGLFELTGTENTSGVVWADVVNKVEASRGSVVRCRKTCSLLPPNETNYTMKYYSPTHSRTDHYEAGHITYSYYEDFNTMTVTAIFHPHKYYITGKLNDSVPDYFLEQHEHWINPRYLVQRVLAGEHRNIGQKTIKGVLCEGIETTDPAALGTLPGSIERLEVEFRLWVSVETGYPVLFESKKSGEAEGKWMESEGILDKFQWNVELDPNFLKANIPSDYVDMRTL